MISDQEMVSQIRDRFRFLEGDDGDLMQRFLQQASIARLDPGQYICHEGRACTHLALVISGSARVYKLGENGREITLYRVAPGESCILTASCIVNDLPFPAFALSESDMVAAVVDANRVKRWLQDSTVWRDYLFGMVATRLADIINVVEEVVFRRMDRRIANYLIEQPTDGGARITATHQEIASDLGTSREVVSRILKEFEHQSLVTASRGSILILDPEALKGKTST